MFGGENICLVAVFLMVFNCSAFPSDTQLQKASNPLPPQISGKPRCVFPDDVTPNGRLQDVDQYDDLYPEEQPHVSLGEVIRCESPPSSPNSTTTEMLMITAKEDEVLNFGRGG